ncbi:hypothetical protein N9180_01745 [Akkermansiaceae bacterium]|jgi:hypothetical protein|nr:hypothetical protein [Akkermansiaceae bacterium]
MNTPNICKSFVAASTITEFAVVALDSNGKVAVATDATSDLIVGVAQRGASAGDVVDVIVHGETRAIAGAALTFSSTPRLTVGAAGVLVDGSDAGDFPVARVLPNVNQTSTSASGEQIVVLFHGPVTAN